VPCCDSGAVLLVYDAAVQVTGPTGKRKVPLREWFLGPRKTVLKRGEIASWKVKFDIPPQPHGRHLKHLKAIVEASPAPGKLSSTALR